METNLFPLIISSKRLEHTKFNELYQQVHAALRRAQTTRGKKMDQIQQLAEQW